MASLCQIVVQNLNGLRPASWKVSVYFGRNADCSLAIVGSRRAALPLSCTRHLTRPVSMCFWTRTECCVPESLSKTFFGIASLDVALLLDSPGFLASRWTEEELARANTSNIQILQLLWPGQTEGATAAFSTFYPLTAAEFAGKDTLGPAARLLDASIGRIVDAVEGLRARAIGARLAFLVREFVIEARKAGLSVHTTLERALIVSGRGGQRILVLPAIGVPDAERYESLVQLQERELTTGRPYVLPPILLYDQTGIRTRWLQHLSWLNSNLACARSVSLVDAKGWLSTLAAKGTI